MRPSSTSTMLDGLSQPHTRSFPPLVDSEPKNATRTPHLPRLQHSPSLPNIWFPYHSSPISSEKGVDEGRTMQQPSAPSSPESKPPAAVVDKGVHIRHVKYASIDPTYRKPSGSKTHNRRRTERDEPHLLLTPPLTPSSSIRTAASLDAAREVSGQILEEILDCDVDSTRILLLENIPPTVTNHYLESVLVNALNNAVSERCTIDSIGSREIVKGINTLQRDKGVVPVVFFDVRSAKIAKDLITETKLEERLRQSNDDTEYYADWPLGVTARCVTREKLCEELCETLGQSRFLDGIEGAFSFTVQKVEDEKHCHDDLEEKQCSAPGLNQPNEDVPLLRGGINIAILQNLLKMFGSLRMFKFIQQEVDRQGHSTIIYHVEYHDVRDAEMAYQEFEKQTMFGMKIFALKRSNEYAVEPRPVASTIEPFPNPATAGESFNGLKIGPAGTQSQIRQRFLYQREDDFPVNNLAVVPSSGIPRTANSPPFFYSTMPIEGLAENGHMMSHGQGSPHRRQPGIQVFSHIPAQDQLHWEAENYHIPPYSPDGLCHYCPSRGPSHNMHTFTPYPFLPSPPTPPIYYQCPIGNVSPILSNIMNTPSCSGPSIQNYEYMDARMQAMPYGWGYEPALTAFNTTVTSPSPVPMFPREDVVPRRGSVCQAAVYIHPQPQMNNSQPQLLLDNVEASVKQGGYHARHLMTSVPASVPAFVDRSVASLKVDASTSVASASTKQDNNQLRLERIISGEDTRTTIMIKNIPNKMTDSDLTTYIAKVCPQKIDFLYLRMDFRNGCNVGYAFVNFIDVEALLLFAKERLGAKWNMFSSEKVLQMSYANYQGKEALIEKFKNSAIMDERAEWRPRIFYSEGENKGLPQPFPAPTHIRRKERSSYNRNTLFPPGVNSHTMAAHSVGVLHNAPRRLGDDMKRTQRNKPGVGEWDGV